MTKDEYEDMNMFSRRDFDETEEGSEMAKHWKDEDEFTSSAMFDH